MGYALPDDDTPLTKATNCIIAALAEEVRTDTHEWPCIRCGDCAMVCPSRLLPQDLLVAATTSDYGALAHARPAGLHRVRLLRRHLPVADHADRAVPHREARRRRARANSRDAAGPRLAMRFEQPTAPHARPLVSVPVVMRRVLFALVPAALCHTWYFGPGLLVNFALTAVAALLTEAGSAALARPQHSPCAARRQRARHGRSAVVRVAAVRAVLDSADRRRDRDHAGEAALRRPRQEPVQPGDGRLRIPDRLVSRRDDAVAAAAHGRPRLPAALRRRARRATSLPGGCPSDSTSTR